MKYVRLGGRNVSVIGLGCHQFGSAEWELGPDLGAAAAGAIVNRALDFGVNLFDTAEIYGNGRSEEILGAALGTRRDEAFVATKVSPRHATRRGVMDACLASLSRLGTDRIDLYQLHWPNRLIPLSWTMAGFGDLLASGRILNAGVSNFSLRGWRRADRHLGRPVPANQVQLNLLDRSVTGPMTDFAEANGRVVIAYSPLGQGLVGGRYDKDNLPSGFRAARAMFSKRAFEDLERLIEELRSIARSKGVTPAQVSLAWVLNSSPAVVAIPGARTLAQVEENAAAADIELSRNEWQRLRVVAETTAPKLERPLWKRVAGRLLGW